MKIKNGIISEFLSSDKLVEINEHYNSTHPDIDAEISINLNVLDEDSSNQDRPPGPYLRAVFKYNHPLEMDCEKWFFVEQDNYDFDVYKIIDSTLEKYHLQLMGCEHKFKRPSDINGRVFNDGRATCLHCDLKMEKHFPAIPGQTIVKISCGGKNIVAKHFWGDCFVQGGGHGIVVNTSKPGVYETAFFEAFPKISGLGTFIRGEGKTVLEAEEACWEKFQTRLACKGHEWDRNVHGSFRDDDYAICVNCGLTATALEPVTQCEKCQKPTTKTFYKKHVCYTHYFEITESERVKENLNLFSEASWRHKDKIKCTFDYLFVSRLQHALFKEMTEDEYLELKSSIRHFIGYLKHNFYVLMLKHSPLRNKDFNEVDYALMDEFHGFLLSKKESILKYLRSEKDEGSRLLTKDLFPEKYLDKEAS